MSTLKYCLLLLLVAGNFFQLRATADTTRRAHGFNALISLNPLFNAVSAKDSTAHFFYSHNLVELQYRYKRHHLGIGFDASSKKSSIMVNNLPKESYNKSFSFAPLYAYEVYRYSKWTLLGGAGVFSNWHKTGTDIISNIETISESVTQQEFGQFAFMRFNYRFSKLLSLELEFAAYSYKAKETTQTTYPLTPALSSEKIENFNGITYSFPSNLSLKISL